MMFQDDRGQTADSDSKVEKDELGGVNRKCSSITCFSFIFFLVVLLVSFPCRK